MKVCVLSSGSKGNTTYIQSDKSKILIDAGNTSKYIKEKLEELEVSPDELDAILITHTHVDHINGLKVFIKKYNIPVFVTEIMLKKLDFLSNYHILSNEFDIKDLHINAFKTSHDAEDSRGYVISSNSKSVVYVTDFDLLRNKNLYIMESNHDVEMLTNGKYPFKLRQRILSDKGHLSNYDSAKYLSMFIGDNTKYVVLAHLSEDNNTEKLAYSTLVDRLNNENIKFNNIIIAKQNEETEFVEV